MGKYTAINAGVFNFFSQLGVPVYMENRVPQGATMPYLTLTFTTDEMGADNIVSGRIWSNSTSVIEVNSISDSLYTLIGDGTRFTINNEGGSLVFYKGSPFIQPYYDEMDTIQCNYFNVIMKIYL